MLEAAAEQLTAKGPGMVSWQAAGLTRPEDVERAAQAVDGTVDALVNNAGEVGSRGMPETGLAEVARAWEADYQAKAAMTSCWLRMLNQAIGALNWIVTPAWHG